MHTIDRVKDYLLVTLEGEATSHAFKSAIDEEFARDDYHVMNDVWQLGNCELSVQQDQLEDIVSHIQLIYPQSASRNKTAIVVSSGLSRAMAQFWAEHAELLPYEIQVFMSLEEAEAWVTLPVT